ncbi:MAG TPA: CDP-glycerol glycerophosphotransferase family protein, partial [Candidatus Limnocylindrales bacterium]
FVLAMGDPLIGVLRDAHYLYRKRESLTSTMQTGWDQPGRYSTIFDLGFLDLVARAKAGGGPVPAWLQNLLLYELSFYLLEDAAISSRIRLPADMADAFHERFTAVVRELDPATITGFTLRAFGPATRDLLLHGFGGETWRPTQGERTKVDTLRRLTSFAYRYRGPAPAETITIGGRAVTPPFAKTRPITFVGRALLQERIVWVPTDPEIVLTVDGTRLDVVEAPLPRLGKARAIRPVAASPRGARRGPISPRLTARRWAARARRAAHRLRLDLVAARRGYRDAWVVMDRIHDADDNGERLFEHLTAKRPDINAWFVLQRGTADWARLRKAGVRRMVGYGSRDYRALMLHATWLVTSDAERAVMQPKSLDRVLDRPTWHIAFLQHGVIKDDLSAWLNTREIDLFVTSTAAELASIADDGTAYRFTTKEASETGLPRFDRLLAKGAAVPEAERTLVIVAPTWRRGLTSAAEDDTGRRVLLDVYWGSPYERAWSAVLRSPEVADALARRGWRLGFMPHPTVQPALARMDLPAHVQPLSFTGANVQDLYARCALLVTDYSSVAFNAAYLDRPVVYYQFDRDEIEAGAHIGRKGYFEYERDGFGPVARTHDEAVAAVVAAIGAGPRPSPEYQARIDRTFVQRDGHACERVVAAIEERSRPYGNAAV